MTLSADWDPLSQEFLWQEKKAVSEDKGVICHFGSKFLLSPGFVE